MPVSCYARRASVRVKAALGIPELYLWQAQQGGFAASVGAVLKYDGSISVNGGSFRTLRASHLQLRKRLRERCEALACSKNAKNNDETILPTVVRARLVHPSISCGEREA